MSFQGGIQKGSGQERAVLKCYKVIQTIRLSVSEAETSVLLRARSWPCITTSHRFAKLSENIGFGINKLMSWKTLTGNDVTIRNERDYVMVTLHLKSEVLEETTQKTTQKTTQNLENEENIIYHG